MPKARLKAAEPSGLRWRKLDLHVHTPGSKDYSGPDITPDEIVARALAKGLNGIAVTDHNTGAWIDRMVAAAKGTDLSIFPGVEITATGGKGGIHIIALFAPDATSKTIENLLAKLNFTAADYGNLEAVSPFGPDAVVEIIDEAGGLAVLAHADSSKGVLADMSGQQRIKVMNSPHLAAVEITNTAKTAKYCDGSDSHYRRRLAYYRASDNHNPVAAHGHSVEGIGSRYSWFKSDGLSLEALRQAFHDPELRIRCDEESAAIPDRMYPRVLSLSVSQGFLAGADFTFHEGLNAIIGGKGVGKSLLVELLRFVLAQPSMIADVQRDMEGKLAQQVKNGGRVTALIQLEADQLIEVSRTYNGHDNPIDARYAASRKSVAADVAQLFPIVAYSQTETLEIAKDNQAQLKLIDSMLDLAAIEARVATLQETLDRSDAEIAKAEMAGDQLAKAVKDLATHDEKLAARERALKSPELDALVELKPKTSCLEKVESFADRLEEAVDDLAGAVRKCVPPELPARLSQDEDLAGVLRDLARDAKLLAKSADRLEADVAKTVKAARRAIDSWNKVLLDRNRTYEKFIAAQGGDRPALLASKSVLEKQRPQLASAVSALRERQDQLPDLRLRRAQLLTQLDEELARRHSLRRTKYAELTTASNGKLELTLERGGERAPFVEALSRLKTGSRLQDSTVQQICDTLSPRRLLAFVDNDDAEGLAKAASIQAPSARTLVSHLRASADRQGILALEHRELLCDQPTIRFRKDDNNYYELSQLSVGQKCTALLIIALADGSRPVVIDQPEDALDITSVYEDVTLQLRGRKHERQFIVTTHNPTVAVAADSDQFHVLRASATQAQLAVEGAIDRPLVKTAVIQHLEGGPAPFAIKTKKYGLATS